MSEEAKRANDETKKQISKFISAVSDKNYAEANKYLQGVVEDKLQQRIDSATEKPLF